MYIFNGQIYSVQCFALRRHHRRLVHKLALTHTLAEANVFSTKITIIKWKISERASPISVWEKNDYELILPSQ